MTKKEFLENDVFMALPDDAEIVFSTDAHTDRCVPVTSLNLSAVRQCVNEDEWREMPTCVRAGFSFTPRYRTALVIDAVPYWYLKERYGITFKSEE